MSRSHVTLLAALIAIAGLAGIVRLADRGEESAVAADVPSTAATPAPTAAAPAATTSAVVDTDCSISSKLAVGDHGADVECLESHLVAAGLFTGASPDQTFDAATEAAVEAFQQQQQLVVDGVVGPQTARQLGAWSRPEVLPPDPERCADEGHSAVVDRFNQRGWLCDDAVITTTFPITSAWTQPDPGTYEVYAKDLEASSTLTGEPSTMTHFVAFTHGKYTGARIAFHSVPKYDDGEFVQPLDSVGSEELQGDSSGCIRVLPDDAAAIWDFLDIGDTVVVAS
jgi:peptidoglycan hydrolase-like protein with peptidoglycan-binding domain